MKAPTVKTIDIAKIRMDGDTQMRFMIDQEVVNDYAEKMAEDVVFPPVLVFDDGKDLWLADGFHRINGALKNGWLQIEAEIRKGSQLDAQWESLAANKEHGLQRSNADKRRAVERALNHPYYHKWADGEVAKHIGVSRRTILRYKDHLVTLSQDSRVVRRGDKTYEMNVANIGLTQDEYEERCVVEAVDPETGEVIDNPEIRTISTERPRLRFESGNQRPRARYVTIDPDNLEWSAGQIEFEFNAEVALQLGKTLVALATKGAS